MMIAEGVAEGRYANQLDAGLVVVDKEERVRPGVRPVGEPCLENEEVRVVRARDVPLLARNPVAVRDAPGGGFDCHVGARPALGDRIAFLALAAHERQDKALQLFVSAGLEHPAMRLGETPAERIGDPTELFPDGILIHAASVTPAVFTLTVTNTDDERH